MWLVIWKGGRARYEDEEADRAVERAYIEFNLNSEHAPFWVVDNDLVKPVMVEIQVTAHIE